MAWNPSVGKESPRRPPLSQGVELRVIFIAFEYEIGERNGARREMGISWGETSDNQRRSEYAGHCEPGQDPPPPRSVVIYANLPVVNGVTRPGVQREISHPSHGV